MPYIGKSPSFGVRNRFVYVASSGDTSVSGADANGATLTFTDGAFVDVYLNGVLLKPTTDYNTTTANTIAGLSALNTSDEVTVVVYDVFAVADTVSATSGGTFNSGVTIQTADNTNTLRLISTDADNDIGPVLNFYRNSASPADGDSIGQMEFNAENDAGEIVRYGRIRGRIDDASDGTEDSKLIFEVIAAGSQQEAVRYEPSGVVFNESSNDVDFRVESNGKANMLFVDGGNDSVIIGHNAKIAAVGSLDANLQLVSGDAQPSLDIVCFSDNANHRGQLTFSKSANDTIGTGTAVGTSDLIGDIVWGAHDGTDFANEVAFIRGAIDSAGVGANDTGGMIQFGTSEDGNNSGTERARFNHYGYLKVKATGSYISSGAAYHEIINTSGSVAVARLLAQNTSYADTGTICGTTRGSSTAYNVFSTFFGDGSSDGFSNRNFLIRGDGAVFSDGGNNLGSGADYAEYFEWKDGNSSNEDRIGHSVVLDGHKIRKATSSDSASSIMGVISGNPSVVGDTAELRWHGKWELDDFNRRQTEEVEVWEWKDNDNIEHSYEKGKVPNGVTVPSDKTVKKIINDKHSLSYDESKKDDYVPRSQRKEWDAVGLMGKLRMLKGQPTGDKWIKMRDISDTVEEWLVR